MDALEKLGYRKEEFATFVRYIKNRYHDSELVIDINDYGVIEFKDKDREKRDVLADELLACAEVIKESEEQ